MSTVIIFGASDPEAATAEQLARAAGWKVAYATVCGVRVHPGNAYKADWLTGDYSDRIDRVILFECDGPSLRDFARDENATITVIDHHRPGDPGYGRSPEEFLAASSVGQVLLLSTGGYKFRYAGGRWGHIVIDRATGFMVKTETAPGVWEHVSHNSDVPAEIVLAAAADHCLEAAYRGRCPGVDPNALMRWRAESRATFQKRPVEAVLADVEAAREILRTAGGAGGKHPCPCCRGEYHGTLADLRGCPRCGGHGYATGCGGNDGWEDQPCHAGPYGPISELPEAAAREGIPFLATVTDRDGRQKVVLQAAPADLVSQFLAGEIISNLVDVYGDPARGFAGGYLK